MAAYNKHPRKTQNVLLWVQLYFLLYLSLRQIWLYGVRDPRDPP